MGGGNGTVATWLMALGPVRTVFASDPLTREMRVGSGSRILEQNTGLDEVSYTWTFKGVPIKP